MTSFGALHRRPCKSPNCWCEAIDKIILGPDLIRETLEKVAASGPILQQCLKCSTNGDSDTHDDFKPATELDTSDISLKDVVEKDIKENSVVICMKGVPETRCGFCAPATKILQHHNAPITSRNILDNPQLKEGVKAFSSWPTFPQVFIKGEFVGGSDIVLNMHQNGQLKELLEGIHADNEKS